MSRSRGALDKYGNNWSHWTEIVISEVDVAFIELKSLI